MMRFRKPEDDYSPLGYIGQYPIHVATLLVIVYSVAMVALALVSPATQVRAVASFCFLPDAVRSLQLWRFATYAFLNGPSIWFVVDMFFLAWFGRDVEKFVGRRAFLLLFLVLLLVPPCVLSALAFWLPGPYYGGQILDFSIFLAFAAIYPGVEFFFGIKVKWLAFIFLAIYSLQDFSRQAWIDLAVLWSSAAASFLYMDYARGFPFFERFNLGMPKLPHKLKVVPRREFRAAPPAEEDLVASIDSLLDKIAKHGLASLSQGERDKLEQVRERLNKTRGTP